MSAASSLLRSVDDLKYFSFYNHGSGDQFPLQQCNVHQFSTSTIVGGRVPKERCLEKRLPISSQFVADLFPHIIPHAAYDPTY